MPLDSQDYIAEGDESHSRGVPHVAVIGAGMSGLFAARTLANQGLHVTVIEKSRGVGGRMSTRRADHSQFDHGAQYFTARDERFQGHVNTWIQQGFASAWPDKSLSGAGAKIVVLREGERISVSESEKRYVGVPAMNSICKKLARELNIILNTRIARVEKSAIGIEIFDEDTRFGTFDRLIVSAPAEQTAELLGEFPLLAKDISRIKMNPCWALMVSFDKPITDEWVGAFLHDSFLTWVARDSTKPGRSREVDNVVIHASHQWTSKNWDRDPENVAHDMLDEFWKVTAIGPRKPMHLRAHRWKYAIPVTTSGTLCYFDENAGIAACGDWASCSRVEGAFLSGMAAAEKILGTLEDTRSKSSSE